jgi:uncharacterized protein YbcI
MASREEIQQSMENMLAAGEKKVSEMKEKVEAAGSDASVDMKNALADAESKLAAGKEKFMDLKEASDEKFDEMWADTKENFKKVSDTLEGGWAALSDKVKSFFA